ncbi:hypothetical protein N9U94_02510 [Acidimicrobiaceae bacterium]|nr:hypothetical protein [Acidimicrobiaceae bacterium]|tara:strand:+ start:305 stop:469 length:165 start_codon:yes stop_codon:yes gene_type:complete
MNPKDIFSKEAKTFFAITAIFGFFLAVAIGGGLGLLTFFASAFIVWYFFIYEWI